LPLLEEAKRRWTQEPRLHTLPTISAALLLTLVLNNRGQDTEGMAYLEAAAEMAYSLGLFADGPERSAPSLDLDDPECRTAASFVAWGVFGWQT